LEVALVDSGSLAVTFEPSALSQITDAQIEQLADRCLELNSKYGVPLYLRWGHEMNGILI
jgi:beta-mannanase